MNTKKILSAVPLGGTIYEPGMENQLEFVITPEQAANLTDQGVLQGFSLSTGSPESYGDTNAATGESQPQSSDELMKNTKAQLLEMAEGLDGVSESRTKAEIVEILTGK